LFYKIIVEENSFRTKTTKNKKDKIQPSYNGLNSDHVTFY